MYLFSLMSAEGLKLPKHIGGNLYLKGLTDAEGLKLPENFDIKKLIAPEHIIDEINMQPEKYFINYKINENIQRRKF